MRVLHLFWSAGLQQAKKQKSEGERRLFEAQQEKLERGCVDQEERRGVSITLQKLKTCPWWGRASHPTLCSAAAQHLDLLTAGPQRKNHHPGSETTSFLSRPLPLQPWLHCSSAAALETPSKKKKIQRVSQPTQADNLKILNALKKKKK